MSACAVKGAAVTAAKIVVTSKNFRIASSSADRDAWLRHRRRDKFVCSWVVVVEHPAEQSARPILVAEKDDFFAGRIDGIQETTNGDERGKSGRDLSYIPIITLRSM
jgi:hypothetical protein